ncbi:hypothetical protein BC749_104105 [Flavobacterium araucananum]|jgi:hypothetical protein|uniref:DUF4177 domain-containing protein n=1 Tax=Flavobacterium araucananum TaxID=946678 RepID=A0A227NV32_9FLAO|nr:hypothetical protein [Flavobacterium araucananum]OXG01570.1 hypothetical protein B0A64_19090 [Flavobacterium araucananum]PWJ98959.1 hypothetical protein BC749_104105 [Flavobacterium araucananum]
MEYKVVPFAASIDLKKNTSVHIAEQLETAIKHHTLKGWDYVRVENITTFVNPEIGCFGIGARPAQTIFTHLIVFQK